MDIQACWLICDQSVCVANWYHGEEFLIAGQLEISS